MPAMPPAPAGGAGRQLAARHQRCDRRRAAQREHRVAGEACCLAAAPACALQKPLAMLRCHHCCVETSASLQYPPSQVVAKAAEACPIIRAARDAAVAAEAANHGRIPPVPGVCPPGVLDAPHAGCSASCAPAYLSTGVLLVLLSIASCSFSLPAGHHGTFRTPSPDIYSECCLVGTHVAGKRQTAHCCMMSWGTCPP